MSYVQCEKCEGWYGDSPRGGKECPWCKVTEGYTSYSPPLGGKVNAFTKHDAGKLRYTLIPFDALEKVVEILEHGAKKYQADNWKNCDDPKRYLDATFRHLAAITRGEILDNDSGLLHAAHAVASLLFMISLELENNGRTN